MLGSGVSSSRTPDLTPRVHLGQANSTGVKSSERSECFLHAELIYPHANKNNGADISWTTINCLSASLTPSILGDWLEMCWNAIITLIRQDGRVTKRIPIVSIGVLHEL